MSGTHSVKASSPPQSRDDTTTATLDPERVAMRAYELYLARGGGKGRELDDWLRAERELSGDSGPTNDEI